MNPAKTLLQFNFDATDFASRAPRPPKIPKEQLETLEKIIKTYDGPNSDLPNRENLRQVYRQFITTPTHKLSSEFDSLRRIRQLAWTLTYSENELPRIIDTPSLQNALQLIENRFRTSMLLGILNALLQAWDTSNAAALRSFLKKHLTGYTGSRKFVQKLKANIAWYWEENSSTNLAMYLIRSPNKLSDVWTYLELPDYMHSYAYFSAVAIAYTAFNNQIDIEHVKDVIAFVKKHNNDKTSRIVLSKLIEKLGPDATEGLRQPVQSYVLQKWQDPRIAGADVRWRDVSDKARQIFTKWITEEDLRFFFDIVAKACGDPKFEYRKAFWLSYLEQITFCRPVLRKNAEHLFRHDPQALQYYRDRQPATLKGGTKDQHAFIIQMGEYTLVEFSTAGACYVYHNSDLPFEIGAPEYHMDKLRSQRRAEHRVIHHNSENHRWQNEFASWLENKLSIEFSHSYRLNNDLNHDTSRNLGPIEDLSLFFDVVAKTYNSQKFAYRKAFWLAYDEHITFCRPVLQKNAEYLFRSDEQALQYYQDCQPATLKGGTKDTHALIIQIGDYTFVEFSTGGVCYIYCNADLPFEWGDSEYRIDELRSQKCVIHQVIQNNSEKYYWQDNFASWLKYKIGIEPLRRYRLGENSNHNIIRCPNRNCSQKLRINREKRPIKIQCPKCNTIFEHQII